MGGSLLFYPHYIQYLSICVYYIVCMYIRRPRQTQGGARQGIRQASLAAWQTSRSQIRRPRPTARGSVSGQRVFLKPAAAATGSSRQQPAAGSRQQQAAAGSRQQQAAAGSSRQRQAAASSSQQQPAAASTSQHQPAPASSTQHAGAGSGRQQQAAAGSRAAAVAVAAAKFQFYSRVSEVTLSPFLGFLCYVLGTKLGGVLLFRMCFEKGVWLFVSCFGSCLIAAAPAAGSSREQQAAAGSSRQQQAAAGSSRQQAAAGSSRQQQAAAGSSRQQQAAAGSSRYAAGMQSWQGDCRCAACTSCVWALGLGLELPAWCFEPEFCNLFYSKLTTVLVIDLWRPTWGCTSSRIANISGPSKQGHKTWAARLSEHKWFRSQPFHVSNSHISRPVWFMPIYMVCTKYHTHLNIDKQTHLHVESCRIELVHVQICTVNSHWEASWVFSHLGIASI